MLQESAPEPAAPPPRRTAQRTTGRHWWQPTIVHWLGIILLLGSVGGLLLGSPTLDAGQAPLLTFQVGSIGSFQLPTPTPTRPLPPTATPVRQQLPPPASSDNSSVISIIQSVFGSYSDQAIAVARCESSLNPSAVNPTSIGGSHATGLFQILYPSTWNTTSQASRSPYDAQANTMAAYEIFKRDGYSWREWSCKP